VGATTPIWVPLAVAVLGLLATAGGAIAGVLITQRRSDRREDMAWSRERERKRERWARDDAARKFELRRSAYVEFYEAAQAQRTELVNVTGLNAIHPSLEVHLRLLGAFDNYYCFSNASLPSI
jgi:hypothetical protein